jgi:hypothetical protein
MQAYKASQPTSAEESTPKSKSVKVVYLGGKMMMTTTATTTTTPQEEPPHHPVFHGPSVMPVPKKNEVRPEDITDNICIRQGCNLFAIKSPEWEDEYCSNECAIRHCKDIFAAFVAGKMRDENVGY